MRNFFHDPTIPAQYQGVGASAVERDRGTFIRPGGTYIRPGGTFIRPGGTYIQPGPMADAGLGCACTGFQPVSGGSELDGLGASAMFGSPTGYSLLDAGLGAALGYALAKKAEDKVVYAAGAALAAFVFGTVGLLGVAGAGLYARSK